jgi:hypothetical protein
MDDKLTSRKAIENDAYLTWFNSKYQELVCSELFDKWQTTDTFAQIGIALTASGSAVAGWKFWELQEMKVIWAMISGLISIIAICHKSFGVTSKIKTWSESSKAYSMIKNQLELLKFDINTSYEKNADNIHKKLREIKTIYAEEDPKTPINDFWLTKSLEDKTEISIYESKQKTNFEEELRISYEKYKKLKRDKKGINK